MSWKEVEKEERKKLKLAQILNRICTINPCVSDLSLWMPCPRRPSVPKSDSD